MATVGEVLRRYRETRVVKNGTMGTYEQTLTGLETMLGKDTPLDRITAAEADAWRKSLSDAGLAAPTIAKRVKVARALFSKAVRWKMIPESPFEHLKSGSQANPKRSHHVPIETIEKVLAACPNEEWRAIIGLCRFAGLRAPSELAGLGWSDVDWNKRALTVRSPKTEHHEGQGQRLVPITARLREILADLKAARISYEEFLKRIAEMVIKPVQAGKADDTPVQLDTPGKRALYSNLKQPQPAATEGVAEDPAPYHVAGDPILALALRVDAAVRKNRPNAWRGVRAKEQVIKAALFDELNDAVQVERLFLIVKAQAEY